ncbi:MAG: hypothetical protein R2751_03350 [Bacteroidales bacterium]
MGSNFQYLFQEKDKWQYRLLYATSVLFTLIFVPFVANRVFPIDFSAFKNYSLSLLIIIYVLVFGLSWIRPEVSGYIYILIYNVMMVMVRFVWVNAIPIVSIGFPLLPLGIFFVLYGQAKRRQDIPQLQEQWRRGLTLAMVSITFIYFMGMVAEMTRSYYVFWSKPFYYMFPLLILFLVAFAFSWKNEMMAGSLILLWYLGITVLSEASPWIYQYVGPLRIYSFPGLVMGFLMLVYWYRYRNKDLNEP